MNEKIHIAIKGLMLTSNAILKIIFYSELLPTFKGLMLMLYILFRWILFALALLFTAWIVPGISFSGYMPAFWAALVMGLVNLFIRPLLLILTLPINILTLGFFTFVINALMLLLVAKLVIGFAVAGFWTALLGSIVLSILSTLIIRLDSDSL